MASTTFTDKVTMVPADWANDVNHLVYQLFGNAQNAAQAVAALGLANVSNFNPAAAVITGGNLDHVTIGATVPAINIVSNNITVLTAPTQATDVVNLSYMQTYVGQQVSTAISALQAELGTMAYQNSNNVNITAGVINNVEIGLQGPASGQFTTLQVSNPPAQAQDVVTLGFMLAHYDSMFANFGGMATQNPNAIVITGGTIDGVTIGSITPPNGIFNSLQVNQLPVANYQVANKQYVDTQVAIVGGNLGTMSSQNYNSIAVTGGTINGTSIGAGTPSSGAFTNLTVLGTQAVFNANFSATTSNFGGLNINEGGTQKLTLYAYGENNGSTSNTATLASVNPFTINVGGGLTTFTSSAVSMNVPGIINAGATGSYGPAQAQSLTLGDSVAHAGGILFLDGADSTNYGTLTYQKSNLLFELNSPQTVGINAAGNGNVQMCGGTGDVTVGTTTANPLNYDINKLTVYGGINALQGVSANLYRTNSQALGNVSGAINLASNSYSAFTMTLTGSTTLSMAGTDSRYPAQTGQFREIQMLVTVGTNTSFAINGVTWLSAAPAYSGKTAGSVALVRLISPNNGGTWYGTTT